MAEASEQSLTLEYVTNIHTWIKDSLKLLNSAKRWPWGRKRIPKLLSELAHSHVLLGCNLVSVDDMHGAHNAFESAVSFLNDLQEVRPIIYPGYSELQALAAGVFARKYDLSRNLAAAVINSMVPEPPLKYATESDKEAYEKARHSLTTVLAWLAEKPPAEILACAERAEGAKRPIVHWLLWGRCAAAAVSNDRDGFRSAFERLVVAVRKLIHHGEFATTEDRQLYLPGMLLAWLAGRDKMQVSVPNEAGWSQSLLDMAK